MSDREILEKAIDKAEENNPDLSVYEDCIPQLEETGTIDTSLSAYTWVHRYSIIFNHRFAQAIWGVEDLTPEEFTKQGLESSTSYGLDFPVPLWQYHLQMMVVAPDPIKYLEEHI